MKVFSFTHTGNRDVNQDYVTSKILDENSAVFVLADGMGGYSSGEIAAKVVADAITEYTDQHLNEVAPAKVLKQAISYANDELYVKRLALGYKEMGCVIVCLLIVNDKAYIAWLGDSRIYVFRNGTLLFQSEDHSLINELKSSRTLKPQDFERLSAIVTKCVMGTEELDQVDVYELTTEQGDTFFLCSDGIHKEMIVEKLIRLNEEELQNHLEIFSSSFDDNATLLKVTL
ncbi:MAG: serine/threonine-protein phosphatase [Muribaculaceae bacterium]|nr:serine/threonine-protein phosphatase [Muribaculaceae bacterium]MBR5086797.1 serine/threonine-protein phosphatase [Muribaculaceae bacterium]